VLGIGAAIGGVGLLRAVLPSTTPRVAELAIDLRVLGVAVVLTLLVGALFALAPTRQIRLGALAAPLRSGRGITRGGNRTRGALVAVEFALALLLATGATLMVRSLDALYRVDRGIRTDNLLTMHVQPNLSGDSAARAYWHQVLEAVRGVPGVRSAATMLHLPMSGRSWHANVMVEGRAVEPGASPPRTAWQSVSADYFAAVGLPIAAGRGFTGADGPDAPRVIAVNRAFAHTVFGTIDPVGKRIQAGNATGTEWATIVGVVADMPHDSLNVPPTPEVYVPMDQRMVGATSLLVRTTGDPEAVAAGVRRTIAAIDRDVPVSSAQTMNDLYTGALQVPRTLLSVLVFFAVAGMLLSAVGVYGLVAYGVRQRRREIGIRAALGADSAGLQWVFVREAIRNAMVGLAAGVPIALVGLRTMRSHVFGVATSDPATLIGVSLGLMSVALVASWIPSRRAARISPATVLQDN
jgi:putative ABC transport system permease protein